jgi:cell cycle arrest protein BUB3
MTASENEFALAEPPKDGVSAIRFAPSSSPSTLLVSSWDKTVGLHDTQSNMRRACVTLPAPVLDCDFMGDGERAVSCAMDGGVRLHGLASGGETQLGSHTNAARCVRYCPAAGPSCVVSGSWDCTLKLWDVRAATACVGTFEQPGKILSLCAGSGAAAGETPLLVVATAGRSVDLLDLRKLNEPLQHRESSLKSQTRCVSQMPSGRDTHSARSKGASQSSTWTRRPSRSSMPSAV